MINAQTTTIRSSPVSRSLVLFSLRKGLTIENWEIVELIFTTTKFILWNLEAYNARTTTTFVRIWIIEEMGAIVSLSG